MVDYTERRKTERKKENVSSISLNFYRKQELVFKKVLDSLSDYSGKDQVICDAIRDLSIGMNGINDCAAGFALLNLPKGKSLGRSKPETNSSNEQAH